MKAVSYIMEDDTMLQISGVPPEKVFVLNLSFLPDTFFFDQNLSFPGHRPTTDYGSSRYRSGDLVAYQGIFPEKEDSCRMLQADDRWGNVVGCLWPIH